jgi:hypothetical protein
MEHAGVALYRDGRWNDAIIALERSIQLGKGGNSVDLLFMAMARQRAGDPTAAAWFDKAVLRMKNRQRPDSEVVRFAPRLTNCSATCAQRPQLARRNPRQRRLDSDRPRLRRPNLRLPEPNPFYPVCESIGRAVT